MEEIKCPSNYDLQAYLIPHNGLTRFCRYNKLQKLYQFDEAKIDCPINQEQPVSRSKDHLAFQFHSTSQGRLPLIKAHELIKLVI